MYVTIKEMILLIYFYFAHEKRGAPLDHVRVIIQLLTID
jgi:hypothetical protein